jgi:hypothetical protein
MNIPAEGGVDDSDAHLHLRSKQGLNKLVQAISQTSTAAADSDGSAGQHSDGTHHALELRDVLRASCGLAKSKINRDKLKVKLAPALEQVSAGIRSRGDLESARLLSTLVELLLQPGQPQRTNDGQQQQQPDETTVMLRRLNESLSRFAMDDQAHFANESSSSTTKSDGSDDAPASPKTQKTISPDLSPAAGTVGEQKGEEPLKVTPSMTLSSQSASAQVTSS